MSGRVADRNDARRRIVLVGNAPRRSCVAASIDAADHVVRFNKAHRRGTENGSRTDELYLVNHGGQMAEWLDEAALPALSAIAADGVVVLPVPFLPGHVSSCRARARAAITGAALDPDRVNHLEAAARVLERAGRTVRRVSVADYRAAQAALVTPSPGASPFERGRGERYPSTGFVAMFRTLSHAAADERIELHGFTFEGWRGHSWDAERRWVEARVAEGRLLVHPVS